jgi:hypothetical protein
LELRTKKGGWLTHLSSAVPVLNVGIEIAPLGPGTHQPGIPFFRYAGILIYTAAVKLYFQDHGVRLVTHGMDI